MGGNPGPPMTNTDAARPARYRAVARPEVATSDAVAGKPVLDSIFSATAAAVCVELFVAYSSRIPADRSLCSAAPAPGIGARPRNSTPSRSHTIVVELPKFGPPTTTSRKGNVAAEGAP